MTSIQITSASRAQDAGLLALADIDELSMESELDYRIIGGQMVSIHLVVAGAADPLLRQTLDADFGVMPEVAGDPGIVSGLERLGYTRPGAANRFVREHAGHRLVIDLLMRSYLNSLQANQRQRAMTLDAVPGLHVALGRPPLRIDVTATLTDRSIVQFTTLIPDLAAALCVKAFAYRARLAAKDAVDVWRLLVAYRETFPDPPVWIIEGSTFSTSMSETADTIRQNFSLTSGSGAQKCSSSPREQAEVRALALHLLNG